MQGACRFYSLNPPVLLQSQVFKPTFMVYSVSEDNRHCCLDPGILAGWLHQWAPSNPCCAGCWRMLGWL